MRHVLMLSGGRGSYAAGRRVADAGHKVECVFTDTIVESDDTYRFLPQAACDLAGLPLAHVEPLCPLWENLPAIEDDLPGRKARLAELREAAMRLLPDLHWLADGRSPWEVFRDERYVGNTRADPCSKILKRELADAWRVTHCDPKDTIAYVGLGWNEVTRMEGDKKKKKGLRERMREKGWRYEAPMLEQPYLLGYQIDSLMMSRGLFPPAVYEDGWSHNNCNRFCCKAGHDHFAKLLRESPKYYAYNEAREQEMIALLGRDATVLRDRRGSRTVPLPLATLRGRLEKGECAGLFDGPGYSGGGCGCFIDAPDEEAT